MFVSVFVCTLWVKHKAFTFADAAIRSQVSRPDHLQGVCCQPAQGLFQLHLLIRLLRRRLLLDSF
jgi:hypothetical protein